MSRRLNVQRFVVIVVLLAVLAANVVITHNQFTAPNPGMNDFLSRWEGARSFWVDGVSPYSDEASLNIQQMIYGRAAEPGEDLGLFAYPMYTVFYVLPVVTLPYAWASAVWMVLLEVCLIAGLFLLLGTLRWQPGPLLLALLLAFSVLNYFAFRGLILGQPGHVVYLMTALTLWSLSRGRDVLAGVALALSTIKPQMGFLLVPFLLLWGLRAGRWRFVSGFVGMFAALMLTSFALQPDWFFDWIGQVQQYPDYTRDGSPVWILFEFFLGWSPWVGYAVRAVLVGWMLWAWYGVLVQRHDERLLWTIAVTLVVTHTAGPRTATPHFVVFMLVLLVVVQSLARRRKNIWNVGILLALLVIPWVHFLRTIVDSNLENLSVFLPPIALVLLTLIVTRRTWWSLPLMLSQPEKV
ncbi:MAG: glycosyltransferase family 87 protein [Chloroflexota bacterium]